MRMEMRFSWLFLLTLFSLQPALAQKRGNQLPLPARELTPAFRASDFIDSIGANTHLLFKGYASSNLVFIQQDLAYLGITHIRDSSVGVVPKYKAFAKNGIRLNFVWSYGSLADFISQATQLERAYPGAIASIEGPNEADIGRYTFRNLSGPVAANAAQKALHAAVRHNPVLAGVPIVAWSLADTTNALRQGNLTGYADFGNLHDYFFGDFTRPTLPQLEAKISTIRSVVLPGLPIISTETGYSTACLDKSGYGTSEIAQAKLLVNTLLDHTVAEVRTTYIYELIDDLPDPGRNNLEYGFGIFDTNNRPKPAAIALRNLLSLLRDSGTVARTFSPRQLTYAVSGMPPTGNSLVFEKSDGTFDIVLWNEPGIWDPVTRQDVSAQPSTVTLSLGRNFSAVAAYDPFQGTASLATYNKVDRIQLIISDHAVVVQASPAQAASESP
jgi:hypothetical protein